MFYIESNRLRLIPLTTAQLQHHATDYRAFQLSLGLVPRDMRMEAYFQEEFDDALANYWLPETAANSTQFQWFTNWLIVHKTDNCVVGGIGVAGLPNDEGETEIGYGIDQDYRRQGIATEALVCLLSWVFKHSFCKAVIAHTLLASNDSAGVLLKAGFMKMKEENPIVLWRKVRPN
ncbi:MAG: GNAT family N-acetyltransferase [Spirosomataceae bacterium]